MKFYISIITLILFINIIHAQTSEQFTVSIDSMHIANAPGLHSFALGIDSEGRWLVLGGRNDGLHRRQPWATFWEEGNNTSIFVIDPSTKDIWNSPLDSLATSIREQLQSTNMQFVQQEKQLIITGGYAFSPTANDHITFPYLTTIDIDGLSNAVINNKNISPFIATIHDERMAVTGGHMGYLDEYFYLVCGQRFDGRYNPMGPDHGPGFEQTYSSEIKKFKIQMVDDSPTILDYSTTIDDDNLHRRDYNMLPQIFPNGEEGFTVFSGVFQKEVDLPFLNCVDIKDTSYEVIPDFNQYLSQYHSAKVAIYDENIATSHNLFFGGISQFTMDENNNLVQDDNVPFVKTISRVTRNNNGVMSETKLDIEMPTLVGAGSEFIPVHNDDYYASNGILLLNNLPMEKTLIGYIYGGIQSSEKNIFFINDGEQSFASNVIFEVYIDKSAVSVSDIKLDNDKVYNINVFPNPTVEKKVSYSLLNPEKANIKVTITNLKGKFVAQCYNELTEQGKLTLNIDLGFVPSGQYLITMESGKNIISKKIIIQ